MHQLETLIIPTETVEFGGQSLTVRGLCLPDITAIVRGHRTVLTELYAEAIAGKLSGSIEEVALAMLGDFVPLASLVIATATDAPHLAPLAAKLPLAVQADALNKIIRLTLVGEGGLEKLMEIVTGALVGANTLISPKT
ncbi:hypothetical protein BPNPMPFG_002528 [Mesorhizobium sp. AR07]|uniref:phage pre-tape measure protein n=1 Tax=Mesorhizobium sp. AR07 TaxID=2865838 RepID=UPI00216069CA|nr:hypothetical protein [Mesorhizobium sp. AR07]UVK46818.1 hypothetical protein BPNPMPFG_002528 [Mesorhizobium sp. AR07]